MAIVNFRRNTISSLRDDHNNHITDHDGKEALLLVALLHVALVLFDHSE